jgi:hypothetical protein
MARSRLAFLVVVLAPFALPVLASAQTTVQGQIIIQEATPSTATPPPPQAQVYVAPPPTASPQSVYVTPSAPGQMQCPAGSIAQVDRFGRPVCMMETTHHRISGGLLGGGIGLLAGGWVLTWVSGLVVGVGGAVGCGLSSSFSSTSCGWTSSGVNSFFDWGWVPLLGPWVQMGYLWNNADAGMYAWLGFEGLLQAGGLLMLIFGAIGSDVTEYQPVAPGYAFRVSPMLGATTQGLSAELRF